MLRFSTAPKGAITDEDVFQVLVRQENADWQTLSVYVALTPDGTSNWIELPEEVYREYDGVSHGTVAKKTYFASFDFTGTVEVRIIYHRLVNGFKILPQSSGVHAVTSQNEIRFSCSKPCKLNIEPDGDLFGCLHLFANPPREVKTEEYQNIIWFEKGLYHAQNDRRIMPNEHGVPVLQGVTNDTLIYLESGAVVCAAIELDGLSHVKIAGGGVLSLLERCFGAAQNFCVEPVYGGFRRFALPSVYIHAGCRDIIIQDVAMVCEFRGVCIRNSDHIAIDNIKMFSYAANGDGINLVNVCDVEIKDCYLQTADDNLAVFTDTDSVQTLADDAVHTRPGRSARIRMRGCVLWTNCRPFMIGGHSTGSTDPRDTVEDVSVEDCDVVGVAFRIFGNSYEHNFYWSGILRILSQSEGLVRNITFQNIRVDWTKGYTGKPIHIEVRGGDQASYTESGGYQIQNVTMKNVSFENCPPRRMPSLIQSAESGEKDCRIDGVTLENVTFNGKLIAPEDVCLSGNIINFKIV